MKRLAISLLIAVAIGAPVATADVVDQITYTINFTGTGPLPTGGSFTWDPDTASFTSFGVTWDTLTFDFLGGFTGGPNDPLYLNTFGGIPCLGAATGALASFALFTGACTPPPPGYTTQWDAVGGFNFISQFEFQSVGNGVAPPSFDVYREALGPPGTPLANAHGEWTLTSSTTPTPEPSSLLLGVISLCALAAQLFALRGGFASQPAVVRGFALERCALAARTTAAPMTVHSSGRRRPMGSSTDVREEDL